MKNHPDFDKNLIHNSTFELDDGRVTKYEIKKKFKMANTRHIHTPYWKSYFGHNAAVDCRILVKFCATKQFFTEFWQWNRYTRSADVAYFLFSLLQFELRRAAALILSPIHLFLLINTCNAFYSCRRIKFTNVVPCSVVVFLGSIVVDHSHCQSQAALMNNKSTAASVC